MTDRPAASMNHPSHRPELNAASAAADWSALFEHLPVGAFRTLPDGRFLRVNSALARLVGYQTEAELLDAVTDLSSQFYVKPGRRREILETLERDGTARGLVSEIYRHKTGERLWVSENAYVIRDPEGQTLFYEGTVEEVTESVHAHQALERSEALLSDITASVPGVVYRMHITADGRKRYQFVSQGVRELYGVEPEAVLADADILGRMRHPDDDARVLAAMREQAAKGCAVSTEFRIFLRSGVMKWVRLSSSASVPDAHGVVINGLVADITESKLAEQALHEVESRWQLALESLGDGVWDWDIEHDRGVVSASLREVYGLRSAQPLGQGQEGDALVHPEDLARVLAARQAHLQGRTPFYSSEHRMRCADGNWIWVLSRGMVVKRDEQGRALRMIGIHTDITERREAEALRRQRDRAETADRAKSELMSRISHELRTPLNAVLGFAQLLELETAASPRHQGWARHVIDSGRHLLALVDDVLDLTHAQAVHFRLELVAVDLESAFADSWSMLAQRAQEGGLVLERPAHPIMLSVLADAKRLRQVLSNLLSNAIKYNRPGGRVHFSAHGSGDEVVFEVADSGAGIAAEYLPRVFQPFERLGAQHGEVPGTGLGLALCKQLVEAMGGTIAVSSLPGQGSCFSVRLRAAS